MRTALFPLTALLSFFFSFSAFASPADLSWLSDEDVTDLHELTVEKVEIQMVNKLKTNDERGFYLNVMQDCWPVDEFQPGAEYLLSVFVSGGAPGIYDWFVVTECNDSNGTIPVGPDGDIDDVIGANLGLPPNNPIGPRMYGPEPVELLDPDPGGFPPGRWMGEEGAASCWCFEVR